MLLGVVPVRSELVPCRQPADATRIVAALDRIRVSVDPCGESTELVRVLDTLASCATVRYEICTASHATRNLFGHPRGEGGTITWNPELRTELESACADDPGRPVLRDPIASLVHEIAHAAQDCAGLAPGEDELGAVRIENIYRRAAGLCQRVRYGDERLPADAIKPCVSGACACGGSAAPTLRAHGRPDVLRGGAESAADAAKR